MTSVPVNEEYRIIAGNLRRAMANYARSSDRGGVTERSELLLVSSGIDYGVFNAALFTESFPGDASALTQAIREATAHYAQLGTPWSCWVCEDLFQPEARARSAVLFRQCGLEFVARHQGMLAERIEPAMRELPRLDVRRVGDRATRQGFIQVAGSAFHLPASVARSIYDSESYWQGHMTGWVGYVNSQPVTTAVTCVDGEAIGVYSVATVREHRGRGYGETITRFAIDAARELSGLERSILQSTPVGFAMYRRMGYRPVGRFAVYVAEAL